MFFKVKEGFWTMSLSKVWCLTGSSHKGRVAFSNDIFLWIYFNNQDCCPAWGQPPWYCSAGFLGLTYDGDWSSEATPNHGAASTVPPYFTVGGMFVCLFFPPIVWLLSNYLLLTTLIICNLTSKHLNIQNAVFRSHTWPAQLHIFLYFSRHKI